MKSIFLPSIAALLLSAAQNVFADSAVRTTIPLDSDWRFKFQQGTREWASPNFDDSAWESVNLPHTWNAFDGQDGGSNYLRGNGWYRTHFQLPADAADRRVLVEFDAASRMADVFVNGAAIGSHVGAFARFRFDITDMVKFGGDNLLAVRVNNVINDFIPRGGDFTQWGGLYRRARLLLTSPVHIATLDHASPGVKLIQHWVGNDRVNVEAHMKLANDANRPANVEVRVTVRDAGGSIVKSNGTNILLLACNIAELTVPLLIEKPRLWNGVADPYIYKATIELVVKGKVLDAIEQPLGLRSFVVKPDAGFFLNGGHVALHGVCRHQDRLDKGWAISEADQREDMALIREMGANSVRLAHYQHDQFFHDLCDENGLAVWAELCFVVSPPETKAGLENAKEQLRELIRQNYNHPSIFFWSIGNESRGTNESHALLKELAAIVREEDPTRPSVYASNHKLDDIRNFDTDILGMNRYHGWYYGDYPDFGKWVDKFHADNPTIPLGVSEYGAGGSIYQHEENPPIRIDQALRKGHWHPEEWQTKFHEEMWLQMKTRPWLWATYIWNMFEFSADERAEGDQFGRNDKGLVTYDRKTRKDAFHWYQANWTTNPMVHIVSKRFAHRTNPKTEIRVYSNCEEVGVKFNGVSLGKIKSADCRFVWPDIRLVPGPNRLEAYAYRGGKIVASDSGGWTLRADGDPLPNRYIPEAEVEYARKRAEREARAAKEKAEKEKPPTSSDFTPIEK